jgi:ketosteroid isomerase-like protein
MPGYPAGMAGDKVETARRALEALGAGEVVPLSGLVARDVIWHVPGVHRFAGEFRGRDELVELYGRMASEDVRTAFEEIHAVVGDDEHVVALIRAALTAPGGTVPMRSVVVLHFDGDDVAEGWTMNDRQDEIDLVIGR